MPAYDVKDKPTTAKRYAAAAARSMDVYAVQLHEGVPRVVAVHGRRCGHEFRASRPHAALGYRMNLPLHQVCTDPAAAVEAFILEQGKSAQFHGQERDKCLARVKVAAGMLAELSAKKGSTDDIRKSAIANRH